MSLSLEAAQRQVRERLLSWQGGMNREDRTPVEELVRAYHELSGTEQIVFCRAVAEALFAKEVELRAGAIRFFANVTDAPDGDALITAIRQHPEAYDGVLDPWVGETGEDLHAALVGAISARCSEKDAEAILFLKKEALAGHGCQTVATLSAFDMAWVEKHAAQVIAEDPRAWKALLYNLQRYGRPVLPVVVAVAGRVPAAQLAEGIEAELASPLREAALAVLAKKN